MITVDEEDVPRTESRNEKNESALSGYKESDVKMMDDVAECTQNESLAILIPVNTQFLQVI